MMGDGEAVALLRAVLARLDALEATLGAGADVWADGAMTLRAAGEYLGGLSPLTVRRIAGAAGWPSKLISVPGSKAGRRVHPARLVKQFLTACPAPSKKKPGGGKK